VTGRLAPSSEVWSTVVESSIVMDPVNVVVPFLSRTVGAEAGWLRLTVPSAAESTPATEAGRLRAAVLTLTYAGPLLVTVTVIVAGTPGVRLVAWLTVTWRHCRDGPPGNGHLHAQYR